MNNLATADERQPEPVLLSCKMLLFEVLMIGPLQEDDDTFVIISQHFHQLVTILYYDTQQIMDRGHFPQASMIVTVFDLSLLWK